MSLLRHLVLIGSLVYLLWYGLPSKEIGCTCGWRQGPRRFWWAQRRAGLALDEHRRREHPDDYEILRQNGGLFRDGLRP